LAVTRSRPNGSEEVTDAEVADVREVAQPGVHVEE
jgi:hypothetical protein